MLSVTSTISGSGQGLSFLSSVGAISSTLISEARYQIQQSRLGSDDPLATSAIPPTLGITFLSTMENTIGGVQTLASSDSNSTSNATLASQSDVIGVSRVNINSLASVLLEGSVPGSPPALVTGSLLVLSALTDLASELGEATTGLAISNTTSFIIPSGVLSGFPNASGTQVNLVAVHYSFDVNEVITKVLPLFFFFGYAFLNF